MPAKTSTKSLKGEAASEATEPARLAALSDNNDVAVQRAVARNPRTPPAALERLSYSSDKVTREAIAGNPNASAAVLTHLGGQFPTQLLDNPVLDFMLLENPGLVSEVPDETQAAIAKREEPADALAKAQRSSDWLERAAIAIHRNTPPDVVKRLAQDGKAVVRALARSRETKA